MKKEKALMTLSLTFLLGLSAAAKVSAGETTLNVFAAASLTETLKEIALLYEEKAPDTVLSFNFDSSGTLKTQIEEGAPCDLFISAAQKQMNELDSAAGEDKNPEGLDLIDSGSRLDLLINRVVLAVPEGNPAGIRSFEDLGSEKLSLLALGNEDVPVGQYSLEILENLNLLSSLTESGKITYGSNVKEVTTQLSEGAADAGIIYATDAFSAGLEVVDEAGEELTSPVLYPAALTKDSKQKEKAQAFLDFLQGEEAAAVFESVGFVMAKEN